MSVFPSGVLIPLCDLKYPMAANHYFSFYQEDFVSFPTSLSLSGTNFIFLPCKKWTDKLQTSRLALQKHILVKDVKILRCLEDVITSNTLL